MISTCNNKDGNKVFTSQTIWNCWSVMIDGINNFVKMFVCDTDAMYRKVRIQVGCQYAAKLQAKDNALILLMIVTSRPQEMLILLEHHDFLHESRLNILVLMQ